MVMKRNAMRKNLRQSILKSFGRYFAIVMIIALGSSMFVGLMTTRTDMVATGQRFMDEQNMFDLRLISTYGWDQGQLDAIEKLECVDEAEGLRYVDAIAQMENAEDEKVYRFYALPEKLNMVSLRGGRMPERADECVIVGYQMTDEILGTQLKISEGNEDTALDALTSRTYTIVGYVASTLYMDMNRGTTSVGSGSLANCLFLPRDGMDMDVYAEINVTIHGDYEIYSDEYNQAMETIAEELEPVAEKLSRDRYQKLKKEAMESYREGEQEYQDGLAEYESEKAKAEQELQDAYDQLLTAQEEITRGEQRIASGEQQLAAARAELAAGEKELAQAREEYDKVTASIDMAASEGLKQLLNRREELVQKIAQIDAEIAAIDAQLGGGDVEGDESTDVDNEELSALNERIAELDGLIAATDAAIQAAELALSRMETFPNVSQETIARARAALDALYAQRSAYEAERAELIRQREELTGNAGTDTEDAELIQRRNELLRERAFYETTLEGVELAIENADNTLAGVMEMLSQMEAEIIAGEQQVAEGKAKIAQAERDLANGKKQLEDGKIQLAQGWIDYEEGKATAEAEFAKAEKELEEAKLLLDEALDKINSMNEAAVYVLDRNSNIGYGSLDSSSNIVAGVSRVLPAFFLLVAALVCITTMTRMIDEERTQIGTLKALGYSNGAIISKYLIYAGSGAVVGCGLGVLVGSMAFPMILWEAYKIMLYITPDILLQFHWLLCLTVVATYTAVMLLVTWYCCRKCLMEEPAELIRPKAPEAGKKILLEYLPFWNKFSFLSKVSLRNIFRYRQRLAMMLVGIGGCTALLLTGFGLRDSIANIVDFQFENVSTYDMTVYFSEGKTQQQQERFLKLTEDCTENVLFYNQISAELEHDGQSKEIYLMTADDRIREFINFSSGSETIPAPGTNEVLLTVGVAESMGIRVGDQVFLRNADMEQLEVTVSGIYDNYVYNYAVISPETVEAQWGRTPEAQMAMVQVAEGQDVYEASAHITDLSGVQAVSISEDLASMVGSMMEALDLVVWVIVFCAGLLAVTVLYNLTNININERIREIATIKVLGFNASETASYVFRENLVLTVAGTGAGLGLGYLLLLFVMSQIKIDMVWFKALILWPSYAWSIALTLLSACVVNLVFYFKLDKINMAEALKSVE